MYVMWATPWDGLFIPYVRGGNADRPVHLCPCRPLHRQYDAYTCHGQVAIPGLVTEYAGLSPTRLRILNGSSRVVGHMYTFDISTSTCIKIVISYMLPCYNAWCICFSRIPPASGLRVNFIIKVLFCSVLFINFDMHDRFWQVSDTMGMSISQKPWIKLRSRIPYN